MSTQKKISVGRVLIFTEDDKIFPKALRLYFDYPLKKQRQKQPRTNLSHVRTFVRQQLRAIPHRSSLFEPNPPTQPFPAPSAWKTSSLNPESSDDESTTHPIPTSAVQHRLSTSPGSDSLDDEPTT